MKKNKTILYVLIPFISFPFLLIFVIFTSINSFCQNQASPIKKAEAAIEVKIPEGLYLYKPNFREDSVFSPLVLVENKKLVDPYVLVQMMGIKSFLKKYVTEKTFNVYVGSELFGKLKNMNLTSISTKNKCQGDNFVPDIQGNGQYEGKPLPYGWLKEEKGSGYLYRIYGSTKIVITPESFQMRKKPLILPVTDSDIERMIEAVQKHIVPKEIEDINIRLEKENRRVIREEGSYLRVAEAYDLDGNGKKDLVGIYYLNTINNKGGSSRDILFILPNTVKVEKVISGSAVPSFMLGGVIDIDQDGVQELIMVSSFMPGTDSGDRRQIEILRYTSEGWVSIFRSKWICDHLGFYVPYY